MILWLEVDSVEDLADFGLAGTNPVDYSANFLVDPNLGPRDTRDGSSRHTRDVFSRNTRDVFSRHTGGVFSRDTRDGSSR